jgi:hypothetical protein
MMSATALSDPSEIRAVAKPAIHRAMIAKARVRPFVSLRIKLKLVESGLHPVDE